MTDLFPIYGSIIRLKTKNNIYDDLLFFVNKIEETYVELISNNGMELMKIELNENKSFVDENLVSVNILYQPDEGYAKQNKLTVGKKLLLIFNDKVELNDLEGSIVDLKEDMIILEIKDTDKKIYIDFEYSGLLDKYNIEKIKIKTLKVDKSDYFIDLKNENIEKIQIKKQEKIDEKNKDPKIIGFIEEDEEEEGPLLIYSIDQQIDDYIERSFKKKQPKKKIRFEVKRYLELVDKYVDLQNGIKIKKIPNNQITEYFLYNNSPLLLPVTSYAYSEKYVSESEMSKKLVSFLGGLYNLSISEQSEYKIILNKNNDLFTELENEKYSQKNIEFSNQKKEDFHKKKKINNKLYLFEDNDIIDGNINYYGVNHGKLSQINSYYINSYNTSTYIDGYLFPTKNAFMNELNTFKSSSVLSKSLQNEENYYILKNQNIVQKEKLDDVCSLYNNKPIYIPFNETHDKIRKYLNELNLKISNIYNCFYNKNDKSFYELIQKFNMFGINEINQSNYKTCRHMLRENMNIYINRLTKEKRFNISQTKQVPFNISVNEPMYDKIISLYNISHKEKRHLHELFEKTIINNHELLLFSLIHENKKLYVDFSEDAEISDLIEKINTDLQSLGSIENRDKPVVKVYLNLQEMYNDKNRIILKQNNSQYENVYDYLYGYLTKQHGYNEPNDVFMSKLNNILKSNDLTKESHKELFSNQSVYNDLITNIIQLKVNENDRCIVKNSKSYYIYDGNEWISEENKKERIRRKRILKISNREETFDEIKENIVNEYILDLINKVQNERIVKIEKDEYENLAIHKTFLDEKYKLIKQSYKHNLLKYNTEKELIINEFKKSDYLSNIIKSPYEDLLIAILGLDELERKYELILKFIKNYSIDLNDKSWYNCIKTGTKLIPKYLHKLANAYLSYNTYEDTLNLICKEEGTINENNDAWIHRESGFLLKNINFDLNYGFDEDGNVIQMTEQVSSEDFTELTEAELEMLEENEDLIDNILNKNTTIKINKRIYLDDYEKPIHHYLLSFCDILGITIHNEDKSEKIAKEIVNILKYGYGVNDQKMNEETLKTYSILGFLLVYVQTKDIYVKKTFPGCNYSFKGFPLDGSDEEKDGIVYLSCVLKIISNKNTNQPYINFKDKTKQEIAEELDIFIQRVVLKNQYITKLLIDKRNRLLEFGIEEDINVRFISKNLELFKPSLYQLNIEDLNDPKTIQYELSNHEAYSNIQDYLNHISMKIEEFIYNKMLNHKPLLLSKYEQPQLKNFCCDNNAKFILNYILEKQSDKDEFHNYLKLMKKYEALQFNIKYNFLKAPSMNIMKQQFINIQNYNKSSIYNEEIIYLFFIAMFNFDNDKPIPEVLSDFKINKPSNVYYNKSFNLSKKIKVLKENEYIFSQEMMISVIQKKYEKKKIQEKEKPIYEKDLQQNNKFEEFISVFDTMSSQEVDAFFEGKNMEQLSSYKLFCTKYSNANLKYLQNFINYINNDGLFKEQYISLNQFLRKIIYFLINILPNNFVDNKNKKIYCKHWNLAPKHNSDIQENFKKLFLNIYEFEVLNPQIKSYLENINFYKKAINYDKFSHNPIMQYNYQKYLLTHILNVYALILDNTQKLEVNNDIININNSVLNVLQYHVKNNISDYNLIKKRMTQIKQSEKLMKTDYLKQMKNSERQVEKLKMNLKLGIWSFALNAERVYKYSKDFYDEDKEDAMKVQSIAQNTYYEQGDILDPHEPIHEELSEEEKIISEEGYNMNLIGEDDEAPEGHDGDEMYY